MGRYPYKLMFNLLGHRLARVYPILPLPSCHLSAPWCPAGLACPPKPDTAPPPYPLQAMRRGVRVVCYPVISVPEIFSGSFSTPREQGTPAAPVAVFGHPVGIIITQKLNKVAQVCQQDTDHKADNRITRARSRR